MSHETPSKWIPITDTVDLAHLGKLGEELGEATSATMRCVIQGMDGKEPETGKVNRDWLLEELADVQAMIDLAVERFGLDKTVMRERRLRKFKHKRAWHKMLEDDRTVI